MTDYKRRRSDKIEMWAHRAIVLATATALAMVVFLFAKSAGAQPVCVSDDCHSPQHSHHHHTSKKQVVWFVPAIIVGAGVWCLFECKRSEPTPAKPDPQPLNLTPPPQQAETFTVRPAQ
jgi:hypothetical protein